MTTNQTTSDEYYAERVVIPEIVLLVATLGLVIVLRLVCPGVAGFFPVLVTYFALRQNRQMFALIPESTWSKDDREGSINAAFGATLVFGFLLLGVCLAAQFAIGLLLVALVLRALIPASFSAYWYTTFAEELFPVVQSREYEKSRTDLDRQTTLASKQARLAEATSEAQSRTEDAERQAGRRRAIQDARRTVLDYYLASSAVLQPFLGMERLQLELKTAIPDTANAEHAFAGASRVLDRLEKLIEERKHKLATYDAQIAAIRDELVALQTNGTLDPELRDAEVQSLEAKLRLLQEQRTQLISRAA